MKTSESIKTIAPALLAAQKEMESAKKDSSNPFFRSKYADYTSVLEACKGPLNNNKITILQPHKLEVNDKGIFAFVETILLHECGEFVSSETLIEVSKEHDPQALGSAITYARRYGLQSLVSLPAEDDDGEKAMGRKNVAAKNFKKTDVKEVTEEKAEVVQEKTDVKEVTEEKKAPSFSRKRVKEDTTTTTKKAW